MTKHFGSWVAALLLVAQKEKQSDQLLFQWHLSENAFFSMLTLGVLGRVISAAL